MPLPGTLRSENKPANDSADLFEQKESGSRHSASMGPRAQRTVDRIIDASREVFLVRGYSGTTIDEIAKGADVSRASFYTYFPSKRDVLLRAGAQTASENQVVVDILATIGPTRAAMVAWVGEYFKFLDVHGSFTYAWTQAAYADDEVRVAGMKRHRNICRQLGCDLAKSAGRQAKDPVTFGLTVSSTLERSWTYSELYGDTVERSEMVQHVAEMLWTFCRGQNTTVAP